MPRFASVFCVCLASAAACHRPPAHAPAAPATRNVFTDSVVHATLCEAPREGENWRTSCQLKNQRPPKAFWSKAPR